MKSFFGWLLLFVIISASPLFGQTSLPAPKQEKLLNGLKVLMWPDAKADKVSIKIRVHSGSAFDPQGKEGLMQMLADNLFPNEAAREFFKEDLGGNLEVVTIYDYIQINASAKPESFLTMLETVAAAVSNPVIDKETTAKLRDALLAKVVSMEADPDYVADQAVAKRLFGTFPYGRPQLGTADSLKKIDFSDLIDAKIRFMTADNATIAVSGNFDKAVGLRAIKRYFGGWQKADKTVPSTFRQPDEPATETLIVNSPITDVSMARIAYRGVARADKDLAAAILFGSILHARLKSIFPGGRADDLRVTIQHYKLPGMFVIEFPANGTDFGIGNGQKPINDLVTKLVGQSISESEFKTGKKLVVEYLPPRDDIDFWLDADTYNITDLRSDSRKNTDVTIGEVRSFADKLGKLRPVSIFLTSQTK